MGKTLRGLPLYDCYATLQEWSEANEYGVPTREEMIDLIEMTAFDEEHVLFYLTDYRLQRLRTLRSLEIITHLPSPPPAEIPGPSAKHNGKNGTATRAAHQPELISEPEAEGRNETGQDQGPSSMFGILQGDRYYSIEHRVSDVETDDSSTLSDQGDDDPVGSFDLRRPINGSSASPTAHSSQHISNDAQMTEPSMKFLDARPLPGPLNALSTPEAVERLSIAEALVDLYYDSRSRVLPFQSSTETQQASHEQSLPPVASTRPRLTLRIPTVEELQTLAVEELQVPTLEDLQALAVEELQIPAAEERRVAPRPSQQVTFEDEGGLTPISETDLDVWYMRTSGFTVAQCNLIVDTIRQKSISNLLCYMEENKSHAELPSLIITKEKAPEGQAIPVEGDSASRQDSMPISENFKSCLLSTRGESSTRGPHASNSTIISSKSQEISEANLLALEEGGDRVHEARIDEAAVENIQDEVLATKTTNTASRTTAIQDSLSVDFLYACHLSTEVSAKLSETTFNEKAFSKVRELECDTSSLSDFDPGKSWSPEQSHPSSEPSPVSQSLLELRVTEWEPSFSELCPQTPQQFSALGLLTFMDYASDAKSNSEEADAHIVETAVGKVAVSVSWCGEGLKRDGDWDGERDETCGEDQRT